MDGHLIGFYPTGIFGNQSICFHFYGKIKWIVNGYRILRFHGLVFYVPHGAFEKRESHTVVRFCSVFYRYWPLTVFWYGSIYTTTSMVRFKAH